MADLISREEAFTTIENVIAEYNKYTCNQEEVVFLSSVKDEIFFRLKELENKELLQNQWISVKDKEPKINEEVLCLTKGGEVYVDKYNNFEEEFILEHLKCTHWQPMSTPPLFDKQK